VFCGPNSSGKSTFIKSILAVAQSLGSTAWDEPLVLNGRFIHLGGLRDVLHHGFSESLDIGWTLAAPDGETVTLTAKITSCNQDEGRALEKSPFRVVYSELVQRKGSQETFIVLDRTSDHVAFSDTEMHRTSEVVREQIERGLFDYALLDPPYAELARMPIYETVIAAAPVNLLPGQLLARVNPHVRDTTIEIQQLTEAILKLTETRQQRNVLIDLDKPLSAAAHSAFANLVKRIRRTDEYTNTLADIVEHIGQAKPMTIQQCLDAVRQISSRLRGDEKTRLIQDLSRRLSGSLIDIQSMVDSATKYQQQTILEELPFAPHYAHMIEWVKQTLGEGVYYLGPLRDDPRVISAIPPFPNQRDVGLKGEYTAAMIEAYGYRGEITYPLPPAQEGEFNGVYQHEKGFLGDGIHVWLKRMGLANELNTSETAKVGYNLTIRSEALNVDMDLTSVGVGVSQVLPIIVMALLAPEHSILIFEQPEVHLHPKIQSILGDFFLGIATVCNKQCLVETHSEHLINRMRRRIAESEHTHLLNQLQIYFVEREQAISRFTPVEPNEYGAILKWPQGFFDESEEESAKIMDAGLKKRQQVKERSRRRHNEAEG
jgi:hypothetical protein